MTIIEHGTITNGGIAFDKPLPLAEGSKVIVQVEVETAATATPSVQQDDASVFAALPFFGLWADREDMADSAEYVRKEREKWRLRPYRQD